MGLEVSFTSESHCFSVEGDGTNPSFICDCVSSECGCMVLQRQRGAWNLAFCAVHGRKRTWKVISAL